MQNDDKTTKRQNDKMSAKESTSFLIEAWALDSGSPAESASLFSLDNGGKLDLVVAGDGNLKLVTDSTGE